MKIKLFQNFALCFLCHFRLIDEFKFFSVGWEGIRDDIKFPILFRVLTPGNILLSKQKCNH